MNKTTIILTTLRLFAVVLMTGLVSTPTMAQSGKTNPAHVGLIYPLSTNGRNAPRDTNKFSLHALAGISRAEAGVLLAGVSGIVRGDAQGTLVSGVSNHVGRDARGVQLAGVLNQIKGTAKGVQVAGLVNSTGNADGFQLAGFMNRTGDAGSQVAGLINVAKRVKGVQVAGLLNVAEASDYPIGIINIIKEGEMQLGIVSDERANTMITFRSGGNSLYGLLGIGYHFGYEEARYVAEAGIGIHLLSARALRLNAELAGAVMSNFDDGIYGRQSLRLLAGYRITPRIELFGGPTINHLMFEDDRPDIRNDNYLWRWRGDDVFNGIYFGGLFGVQFSL